MIPNSPIMMNENASTSTLSTAQSLPHFASMHSNYTRRLLRGRHPRSFPRQSELWHHYKASSTRLNRILKGHHLWNILDEQADHTAQSATSPDESAKCSRTSNRLDSAGSGKYTRDPWNGIRVDTKGIFRLHYGMNCVLINSLDEVLCVNDLDEIVCKPIDQLCSSDQICFKLFDLLEPTNPGPIRYGKNIWLQILKSHQKPEETVSTSSATTAAGGSSHSGGTVLAAKLFGPPEMTSTQLNEMERLRLRSNKPKQTTDKHTSLIADALQETAGAQTATGDNNDKKVTDQSEICGLLSVVRVFADKNGQSSRHADSAADSSNTAAEGRFRSKQAWHLGQWTVQNAMREQPEESFLSSCSPVYLEQDLYCLATTHGNKFKPWPWTTHHRQRKPSQRNTNSVSKSSAPSPFGNARDDSRPGTADSAFSSAGVTIASGEKRGVSPDNKSQQTNNNNDASYQGARGCLRRVVKRGLPYEHLVDRRCVWRFMVADNPRDLKMLSVKEQKAQKLLRKAAAGLNESKSNRQGSRVHKNLTYNGQPLVGGEMFPRMLRGIVAAETFRQEEADLRTRRQKEEEIARHFREMYEHTRSSSSRGQCAAPPGASVQILRLGKSNPEHTSRRQPTPPLPSAERSHQSEDADTSMGGMHWSLTSNARVGESTDEVSAVAGSKGVGADASPRSFGKDVLSLHRTFVTVNNKVTVNLSKPRAALPQIEAHGTDCTSPIPPVESAPHTQSQLRMSQKLDLLAQEDQRVQAALRYRERLMRRNEMASLFENSGDFDVADIRA